MERIVLDTREENDIDAQWYTIPLQHAHLVRLDKFAKEDASIQGALECLYRFLLGGGIHVKKRFWKASQYFNGVLNTTYAKVCRDIIRSKMLYGIVVIGFREDSVPFVYDLTELDITILIHVRTNAYRYRIRPRHMGLLSVETSRSVLTDVLAYEQCRPDPQGRVTSTINTLYPMALFSNSMIACANRSEVRRAVPPLITEARETKLEEKQFQRDYFAQGDNTAIHRRNARDTSTYSIGAAEEREWQTRASQVALGSAGWSADPVSGQPRYPVDIAAGSSIPIPIEEGRTLVTNTPSESPAFLMELLAMYEADVGKVMGVPIGLWGSQRSPVAVDMTIMTVFNASLQVHRVQLQYVMNNLLDAVYGAENAWHAALHYDPTLSLEDTAMEMNWDISFPGLLDPEMINMIMEQGYMDWEHMRPYFSSYFGIPLDCVAKERLDAMTGRPLAEVAEEQMELEHSQLKAGIQEQKAKTLSLGGKLSDRSRGSGSSSSGGSGSKKRKELKSTRDKNTSQKSQATKKANIKSQKLAKKPKLRE